MKYAYFYIWIVLARIFLLMTIVTIPLGSYFRKLFQGISNQERWIAKYKNYFLEFPGGIIDWMAFGLLVGMIFLTLTISIIGLNIEVGSSKFYLWSINVVIGVGVYYFIYDRNIEWLKDRISTYTKANFEY